jgi:ketosteroid isomerase-like protein
MTAVPRPTHCEGAQRGFGADTAVRMELRDPVHQRALDGFADVLSRHDWDRLGDFVTDDATFEYPQSGERFRGIANIRAQFENYPGLEPGTTRLDSVSGGATYALTPTYTVIDIEGSGDRGTAVFRIRYHPGDNWWAISFYELRDGRISHSRAFFAADFEAPDWRAPYSEAP